MLAKLMRKALGLVERPVTDHYESEVLNRRRVEREALRSVSPPHPLLFKVVRDTGSVEVTDFGGAAGAMARDLVAASPDLRVTIVENATMVRLGRRSPGIDFTTEIPAACDVFFSSGAVQYLPEPLDVLTRGFVSARRAVVLVRNSFSDKFKKRMQKSWLSDNGEGPKFSGKDVMVAYEHRTIRESDVHAIAEKQGFACTVNRLVGREFGGIDRDLVFLRRR